jgi:spore coat protein H
MRQLAATLALALLASGCGEDGGIELTPFEELEHPSITPVPQCVPWRGDFVVPELEAPTGGLRMQTSALLLPTNVSERIIVRVLNDDSTLDTSATGQLRIAPATGITIVSEGIAIAGYGEVVLQISQAGPIVIELTLDGDPRIGRVELEAYEPRLPIWQLRADEDDIEEMFASPGDRITIDGEVEVDGESHLTEFRVHGGASRDFPKKSLRLNLQDSELASGESKIILRAEYNDKSMLRTWLGYELFRNGSFLPTPKSEYIHLRLNDRYYGLMHRVERIDKRFLGVHGLGSDGNLYEADPPSELAVPGGNLTPLETEADYFRTYQWHAGPGAWTDLIRFIEFTLLLPDTAFEQVIADEVQLNEYLRYLAVMAVLQNQEHIRKNYYLYREPEGPVTGWMALPWDLDLTFGHLWSEIDDVLDERVISDSDLFVGEFAPERFGYYNQLTDRVLKHPDLRERFLLLVAQLLDSSFTDKFLEERVQYALCLLEPDLLSDKAKRASNDEFLDRVAELATFVQERRTYVESVLRANNITLPSLE